MTTATSTNWVDQLPENMRKEVGLRAVAKHLHAARSDNWYSNEVSDPQTNWYSEVLEAREIESKE